MDLNPPLCCKVFSKIVYICCGAQHIIKKSFKKIPPNYYAPKCKLPPTQSRLLKYFTMVKISWNRIKIKTSKQILKWNEKLLCSWIKFINPLKCHKKFYNFFNQELNISVNWDKVDYKIGYVLLCLAFCKSFIKIWRWEIIVQIANIYFKNADVNPYF